MKIDFLKMSGTGNDFVMVDNRENIIPADKRSLFAAAVGPRKTAIGCDGIILLEQDDQTIIMRFLNPDGSEVDMCGNGARCFASFLKKVGAAGDTAEFQTGAGIIRSELTDRGVKVQLTEPAPIREIKGLPVNETPLNVFFINTGVPHVVLFVNDIEDIDIRKTGSAIRYHQHFAPAGTNANFVKKNRPSDILVRTYERGVEDETLACGTGSVASALVYAARKNATSPVKVTVRSGEPLWVYFKRNGDSFQNVFLEGAATVTFSGSVEWNG